MKKGCLFSTIGLLVLLTAGLVYYFVRQNKPDLENTKTNKAEYLDISKKIVASGTINPRQEINIKPQVSGVIDELFVVAGEIVEKGKQLARIKLVPSQVNINQAQTQVELAKLRFDDAKRELQRQQQVNTNQLDIETARANYENAKTEEARQRSLYEGGVISEQQYNQYKLDLELSQTSFENAKIVSQNNLSQYENRVEIAEQELISATANLRLLKEGVDQNSKQVANIVSSTVSGMVLDVPVEEGSSVIERNNFNEGTTIATVANMNTLIFEGTVDEADVGSIKQGMPIILKIGAIPDQEFSAVLEFISPKGVKEEGTIKFEVRAAVEQTEDNFLRAGYSANGDIVIYKKDNVLAIKERDILYEKDETFVEVKNGDGFDKVKVVTGISDGINTEIIEGLDTSQLVRIQQETAVPVE
ncbi:efflux RND transporter periplasmic adaptor subunit [Membranihabitans marinus]|uniref:efflux RND transporter periplasmic adaptor subunit n=1 Tax=Membranihabitans marinus TaxID=1227546 RepID=UPI001F3290C9|nr:HlyD family efflux transporter periplasmic adaptor subunit [Membranihabitans marinus]